MYIARRILNLTFQKKYLPIGRDFFILNIVNDEKALLTQSVLWIPDVSHPVGCELEDTTKIITYLLL